MKIFIKKTDYSQLSISWTLKGPVKISEIARAWDIQELLPIRYLKVDLDLLHLHLYIVVFTGSKISATISSSQEIDTAVTMLSSKSVNGFAGSSSWTTFWSIYRKWLRSSVKALKGSSVSVMASLVTASLLELLIPASLKTIDDGLLWYTIPWRK